MQSVNVVSFGGGTNSTAMIIGMYLHKIPIDLITFADTGGEQPHTYEYIEIFNEWLKKHGIPEITVVFYTDKAGNRLTLEEECLKSGTLPSIAYGFKKCSLKHKIGTQEKFCNHDPRCKAEWKAGRRVHKYIGYDAGETRRVQQLFQRAVAMEHNAAASLITVKGLGRKWSWEDYHTEVMQAKEFEEAQISFDQLFPEAKGGCLCGAPCGCYDG